MSLLRAALVLAQATFNHLATTAPHPVPPSASRTPSPRGSPRAEAPAVLVPEKVDASPAHAQKQEGGTLYGEEWRILRLAPTVFKLQDPVVWTLALCEIATILYARLAPRLASPALDLLGHTLCPAHATADIRITTLFLVGFALSIAGATLRLTCYRYLGHLFTFNLWKATDHVLVTTGPYSFVRHPSYAGSMLLNAGLPLSLAFGASGAWAVECGVFGRGLGLVPVPASPAVAVFVLLYWAYYIAVGVTRARAEDAELRRTFGAEWDTYAAKTRCWFFWPVW